MSKKRHQERRRGKSQAQAAKRRMYTHMITLLLTVASHYRGGLFSPPREADRGSISCAASNQGV